MKKFLLFLATFLILSTFANAISVNDSDNILFYNLDVLENPQDLTPNSNDGTKFGTVSLVNGIFVNAFEFDGSTGYVDLPVLSGVKSWSEWFKTPLTIVPEGAINILLTTNTGTALILGHWTGLFTDEAFTIQTNGADAYYWTFTTLGVSEWTADTWYNYVVAWDSGSSNYRIFLNGTDKGLATKSASPVEQSTWSAGLIGRSQSTFYNNVQDMFSVWNRSLNGSDALFLYNNGTLTIEQEYPFIPAPNVTQNESTETNVVSRQIGSVALSTSFQTIENVSFNVSVNNTVSYFSHVFEIEKVGGTDRFIECNVFLDGNNILQINRTIDAGTIGNMYMVTDEANLTNGTHTEVVQCRRGSGGGGTISMSKGVCIGHLMIDEQDEVINHMFNKLNLTNLTPVFRELAEFNFTVSNFTNGTDVISSIVVDWNSQYDYNSTGNITTFIQIDGDNCSEFQIGGNSGESFVAGGVCGTKNLTPNQVINIKVFGKDSGGLAFMNIFVKEFLLETQEILFGEGVLTGVNITFSTLTNIGTFPLANIDKASVDLVGQVGLAVKSNSGSTILSFQAIVNGTKNLTTEIYQRTVNGNGGVVMLQDVLEDAPIGSYDINLMVACANSNCTITGSNGVAYFSNVVTEVFNSFNVSAFDNFDNSSISNFSITLSSGAIFNTTTGFLSLFSSEILDNLTAQSNFNGGYFGESILNHNTSQDLNFTMNQTNVGWDCIQKVSGNNLNCSSPLESKIFNYNVIGNPHSQSLNVSGYFESIEIFNVTALLSEIKTSSFFSTNLSINSSSGVGTVSNCSYNVSGVTFPSYTETVNGTPLASVGLINGSYSVMADCVGFAVTSLNVTINSTLQNLTFNLFTVNSISFNVFDLETLLPVSTLVEIELLGSSATFNVNTSNGSVFIDGLNDDTYKITATGSIYNPTILFGTISGGNHLNISIFMKNGTEVDFLVQDQARVLLGNATLTFIQIINGSEITIGQAKTDFSGRASVFLDETVEYSLFVVKQEFNTFTGQVTPTQSEYTIIMQRTGDTRFVSIFEDLKLDTTFTYTPLSGFAIAKLILNSAAGALEYYGMNTTYASINYFTNISGVPAGGVETFNITGIDPSVEPTVTIQYFFKYNGRDLVEWNATYLVSDIVATNMTLESGLFDDLVAVDKDNPVRGLMGALIILAFILIFSFSRDLTITSVGGLIGLGVNWKFGFMPETLLTVSMIVIVILIIADNIGGNR